MIAKERKRTLSGILHDVLYRLPHHLPNGRRTTTNNHAYLQGSEKRLIQGNIIVFFPWNERFFCELCNFSWYLQVITRRFYKRNEGGPVDKDGNLK